jgi:ferredoxin
MERFLPRNELQKLLNILRRDGYDCIGPQVRDGAIVYRSISKVDQLPVGWHDDQRPGRYRLAPGAGARCFDWANGPEALKPMTFVAREVLWSVVQDRRGGLRFQEEVPEVRPTAVIGVRACDISGMHLQDQHFAYQTYQDPYYNSRRRSLLLIAVDCARPAETCFCHSTGDGPAANAGFDIALTELDDGFIARARSGLGQALLEELQTEEVSEDQRGAAEAQRRQAVSAQTRRLAGRNLKDVILANLDHPALQEAAERCLSCGNCTSVCPTCFCHSEGDTTDLEGRHSSHHRQWDSCFNEGHSYMHSFVVRDTTRLRYRQWFTHKLATWHEQYGRSGCVGCGRCITWCPVGIDIVETANAISEGNRHANP